MEFMVILAILYLLMVPAAFFMVMGNRKDLQNTHQDVDVLGRKLGKLDSRLKTAELRLASGQSSEASQATGSAQDEEVTRDEPPKEVLASPEPVDQQKPQYGRKASKVSTASSNTPPKRVVTSAAKSERRFKDVEQDLSSKWMIWIGGIALALGGGFLVKYSIDAGLLAPSVRVTLGTLFGILLLVGGETIRRRSREIEWLKTAPEYLPSAISAAGLFTLFASLYSAYALYGLISGFWSFVLLAGVSGLAVLLARVHGKFFAYLGMVAGLAIPMLVSTGSSSAWALFPYLMAVSATTLYVAREKAWSDVAGYTLLAGVSWVFLWILGYWHAGDILPVGLYLLSIGGVNSWLLSGASPSQLTDPDVDGMLPVHAVSKISSAVTLISLIFLAGMVRLEHFSVMSLMIFGTAVAGQIYLALRNAEHDLGAISAMAASLFLLATWHVPDFVEMQNYISTNEASYLAIAPIAPPGFEKFVTACVLFAGTFGFGIYAALPGLLRRNMWATVGTAFPIAVLVLAYGRLNEFETSIPFAAIAFAIAGLMAVAVETLRKQGREYNTPVAAYAAGSTTAVALALTMLLRDAWLTTAFALEIVALAHIWKAIPVKGLRTFALGLGAVVLVRLFANVAIFDYSGGNALPIVNWLWYGYGLTAIAFAYAARLFDQGESSDKLISMLKAGSALLAISFITLEFRVLFGEDGRLLSGLTATEAAMQTLNWSVATTILMRRELKDGNQLFGVLRKLMTGVSLFGLIVLGGMYNNILFDWIEVGAWPILNLQLMQFFIPGLLYAFKARMAELADKQNSAKLYGIVSLFTLFLWVTLGIRHLFHPNGSIAAPSEWEWYSYSVAWLLYAVALIGIGIKLTEAKIRMAGLAILGLVVLKVFLFDMGHLDGIARALSFMGLGGALIGLGYLYQYFKREEDDEEESLDRSNQFKL